MAKVPSKHSRDQPQANKKNKKVVNPYLPQALIMEIFLRLPTKSIGKCRCLSREWHFHLSTPDFIKAQKTDKENLLFITCKRRLRTIDIVKNDTVSFEVDIPNSWDQVHGSCDGLVLLRNRYEEMFLVNPTTLQQLEIPEPPTLLNELEDFILSGFGYDCSSDDYKIISISYYCYDEPDNANELQVTLVDVYSVKRGVWKRVDSPDHVYFRNLPGCVVNGTIHWLVDRRDGESGLFRPSITAFGLTNEVFHEIYFPTVVDVENARIMVLGGCLCIMDFCKNVPVDIWIMKEYGVTESWTKFSIVVDFKSIIKALCFIGDEELLLRLDYNLVLYNMKDGSSRVIINGAPAQPRSDDTGFYPAEPWSDDTGFFVESLLSPFPGE